MYEPQMAVRVGSAHLSMLLRRDRHPLPPITAYNAGDPSVKRWLARRGHLQVGAFIEDIPSAETTRYTHKLESWWTVFRVLYVDDVKRQLGLAFRLPAGGGSTADRPPPRPRR